MRRVQIICKGRVQGVFFRKYTYEKAILLGLSGWVRNQLDGSVLIQAAGSTEQMDAFIDWCHQGSPMSIVNEVIVDVLGSLEALPQKFEIRH